MKYTVYALSTLVLCTTMHPFAPIKSARQELEQNRDEVVALKAEIKTGALPKVQTNLDRLADAQQKIEVGLQRIDETKGQMGALRGFAHVIDPLQRRSLSKLTASYNATAKKVHTLAEQFAQLAVPLKLDLVTTKA